MGKFTRIPADTFSQIQMDAGILLYKFDPAHPEKVSEEDIICPTTGGITAACEPTYSDMGEDVDNCPTNLLELKHLDGWNCHLDFTSLGTTPKSMRLALGAADVDTENPTHIIPRVNLKTSDAADIWWVGDRADGGFLAVCLRRALSTSGFSLQTSKNGKGQTSVTLTGHVSVATQNEVPMEFYSIGPTLGKLTVTSTEGTTEGMTKLSVTEKLNPGNKYKYKLGSKDETVEYGQDLKEGWTDLLIGGDIAAETNTYATVAEVDGDEKAVAVGSCTINKKAGE